MLLHYAISTLLYRGTIARTTYIRIQRPAHVQCMLLGRILLLLFTVLRSGYLERLKEQLNGVKTVRVPVALSRLIAMAFFHPCSPFTPPSTLHGEHSLKTVARNSARFISEVCNRHSGFLLARPFHPGASSCRRHGYVSEIF